ncbi:zinc ribbon domain-containing protein [Georgenia sp. EYE_87]|uniref:zinc-ribbon domain-containing protein n=1 Tax=Georgenia sp. EYE_87 TaxID=2853448 RepID=UPI002004AE16|nr:zinc-ribbon domain-containing protein [Georgenia sp. EYE_87]MCK6209086.1 zinc ribbon domain-containing protein [Georgenia sp. EYE_87]
MIILGVRGSTTLLATMTLVCPQCHNPAAHRLHRIVNKFSLFFVPLFPVSTKHVIDCTFCGLRRTPTKAQAAKLQRLAQSGGPLAPPADLPSHPA